MSNIILHHCPQTRSMRTLWLLHELKIDFSVEVYPFDKTLRSPEFLSRSPAGRVPALEIDGAPMFETGAITEYLCESFSPDVLGRRPGHAERRDWLVWVHFSETISQHTAACTQQHVALREDWMRSSTVMKLEAARIGKCFAALEARLSSLAEDSHLLASGFSAADVSVGQAVYMARYFRRLDDYPAVAAWYARISSRAAFQASLPDEDERLFTNDFFSVPETS